MHDDLYERAHDLHFKRRDYTSALAAWDQYLTLAPSGSLALEARFHRGVCLVRLGRNDEARRLRHVPPRPSAEAPRRGALTAAAWPT